jgi:hypothetical protein
VSSRARSCAAGIGDHLVIDDVGEPAFQRAHRLPGCLPGGDFAVKVGPALSLVAQPARGHDVQHPVDLPVAGPREPVADLIAGGGIDGRSAIREAKCARVGNLAASPTSASSRAAPDGPIPCRSVNVVPVAASSAVSSLLAALLRWQLRSRSLISSGATRRRALPAASRGRTRASSALAWAADRLLWAPPGMSPGQQLVQLGDHPGMVFAQ